MNATLKNCIVIGLAHISLFFAMVLPLSAQQVNQWIGRQPGHETDWHYAENWSLGRVPEWNHDVIISAPDAARALAPVISRAEPVFINSLVVYANGGLVIKPGSALIIYGVNSFDTAVWNDGILMVSGIIATEEGGIGGRGLVQYNPAEHAGR